MSGNIRKINILCAILMVILLAMQFMPYWHMEEKEKSVSIQGFTWFPTDNQDLESFIREETGEADFGVTRIIGMPILELFLCAIGAVLCCCKSSNPLMLIFPTAAGLFGLWGYLTKPAFRLGGSWAFHLILCIILLILGAAGLVYGLKDRVKDKKKA